MEKNPKVETLLKGMVIDDRPRYLDGTLVPIKDAKFANDGGLQLPTRAFTEEEIAAVRTATSGAEEGED